MNTPKRHRIAAAIIAAVAILAGCSNAGDRAGQTVTAYITSEAGPGDGATWCDHDWTWREKQAECKAIAPGNYLTSPAVVKRTFGAGKVQGMDAPLVVVQAGYAGNSPRTYGYVVVSYQGQLYVERHTELRATINTDDNATVLKELGL